MRQTIYTNAGPGSKSFVSNKDCIFSLLYRVRFEFIKVYLHVALKYPSISNIIDVAFNRKNGFWTQSVCQRYWYHWRNVKLWKWFWRQHGYFDVTCKETFFKEHAKFQITERELTK